MVPTSLQYYLIALGQCTSYAFAIAAIYSFAPGSNTRRWRPFLWALLPLQLVYAFVWGAGKFWLIEPVFIILICSHYLKRQLRLRAIALSMVLIGVLIFPLIALFRSQSQQQDPLTRIAQTAEDAAMMDWQDRTDLIVQSVMRRAHLVDSLAVVVKYSAMMGGELGGVDYLLIPAYAFLPRAFWPDKPIGQGVTFGMEFFGTSGGTSIGVSNPGDLYRHLGLGGIIGGMFVLGVLYRVAYEYLIVKRRDDDWRTRLPCLFVYVFVFAQFYLAFEANLSSGLSEMLKKLLLLGLVAWYMRASPTPRLLPQTHRI